MTETMDPESECINACVKAIDAMVRRDGAGYRMVVHSTTANPGRVLRYLADRYGVVFTGESVG